MSNLEVVSLRYAIIGFAGIAMIFYFDSGRWLFCFVADYPRREDPKTIIPAGKLSLGTFAGLSQPHRAMSEGSPTSSAREQWCHF